MTSTGDSVFGWPEQMLRHRESFVHTHAGSTANARLAQDRALELYPREQLVSRCQIELHRATCLVRDGHISEGLNHATTMLQGLPAQRRQRLVLTIASKILTVIPESERTRPPYNSGPLFHPDAFKTRTQRQTNRAGFAIVTSRSRDGELIGFSFGLPFAEGQWWSGETTPPPQEVLAATKFAVIELVLLRQWRGRGIGRQLLDQLLGDRPEPYATLCSLPEAPVRKLYQRWGWTQFGSSYLAAESLTLDVLALPLK